MSSTEKNNREAGQYHTLSKFVSSTVTLNNHGKGVKLLENGANIQIESGKGTVSQTIRYYTWQIASIPAYIQFLILWFKAMNWAIWDLGFAISFW